MSARRERVPLAPLAVSLLFLLPLTQAAAAPPVRSAMAPAARGTAVWTPAAAPLTAGGGNCTSTPGGSSAAANCPSWGGFVRTMPGTVCTMNVGNNDPFADYTNKIRNCSEAQQRLQGLGGSQCDVLNIIELNSADQCGCACDKTNTCTLYTSPDGSTVCIDDPGRSEKCKKEGFGYYDPDRCELCEGCGAKRAPSCESEAKVFCDPRYFEDPICHEEWNKGCDCMCTRKGPCVPPPQQCVTQTIIGPADCDVGNYATCEKCDYDGDGSWDWGSCVAHPSHCGARSNLHLQDCLQHCSTPIVEGAAQWIADAKVRTISGDFNCDPDGCSWFGTCPWVDDLASYGLQICHHTDGTTIFGCWVDLVLSNSCGCAEQVNHDPSPGDHFTIVFNGDSRVWTPPVVEILSANSASSCPDPDQTDSTSDRLGAFASCPTTENGHPVGSCSSWGHTPSAKLHYYTRADSCTRPDAGIPKVLVCDQATAQASATCTTNASSGSSSFVTVGKANASQGATCQNGVPYNPPAKTVLAAEIVTPRLVQRSDGNLYLEVDRDAHRDRGGDCSAALASGTPCTQPVQSVTGASLGRIAGRAVAPVCVDVAIPNATN